MAKSPDANKEKSVINDTPVVAPVTNDSEYITLNFKGLTLPWAIVLSVTILTIGISSALYFGLKARPVATGTTTGTPTTGVTTYAASEFAEVSIPYVAAPREGDANAKVTILEFSDLVCPYCQKFHQEAYQDIAKNYIATGKASLVYKHYPLSFHNPAATIAAKASICINKLYNESKMFAFQNNFFADVNGVTQNAYDKSNNPVINIKDKEFYALMAKDGIDTAKVKSCMSASTTQSALDSDIKELTTFQTDVVAKGISQGLGTPSFIIGIVKDGVLTGRLIEGAYPSVAFTNVIEEQLKK